MTIKQTTLTAAVIGSAFGALLAYYETFKKLDALCNEIYDAADKLKAEREQFNKDVLSELERSNEDWARQMDRIEDKITMSNPIVYISENEFGMLFDDYKSETLSYYAQNRTVYDEEGYKMDDPKAVLGDDFESELAGAYDDAIYIRNKDLKTDYQVIMSYGDPPEEE